MISMHMVMLRETLLTLRRKRHVRLLYMQHEQEIRMYVNLLRVGFAIQDIAELIKRLRKYAA